MKLYCLSFLCTFHVNFCGGGGRPGGGEGTWQQGWYEMSTRNSGNNIISSSTESSIRDSDTLIKLDSRRLQMPMLI